MHTSRHVASAAGQNVELSFHLEFPYLALSCLGWRILLLVAGISRLSVCHPGWLRGSRCRAFLCGGKNASSKIWRGSVLCTGPEWPALGSRIAKTDVARTALEHIMDASDPNIGYLWLLIRPFEQLIESQIFLLTFFSAVDTSLDLDIPSGPPMPFCSLF